MNIESTVKTVKARANTLSARGQNVARISFKTLSEANGVVIEGVQALFKGNTEAVREIIEQTRTGVDKARADGVRAVIGAPLQYLPPRKEFIGVLVDNRNAVVKTGEDLIKLMRKGFDEATRPSRRSRAAGSTKRTNATRRRKAAASSPAKRTTRGRKAAASSAGTTSHATQATTADNNA